LPWRCIIIRPTAVWLWDNSASAYVDLTSNIYINTDFNFLADSADKIYIGSDRRFIGVYADLTTNGDYTSLLYKYLLGSESWEYVSLIDSYSFSESKYCRWTLPENWAQVQFTSTVPNAASPPDNVERYWIEFSASTVTTTAVIDKLRLLPYASYTSPKRISEFLQIKRDFDYGTTPTDLEVENMIRRQEDYINYRTRKSWKLQAVVEETDPVLVDYSRYGFYLRYRNFWKIYSLKLWDGGNWKTLVEGREQDYHVNYDLGQVIISRMFTIPAVYGMVGRYSLWGQGGFKNSVKIDYIYGRNPETDPEFYIVEDIATKLVAKDLLQHSDYTQLIVSGSDKVPLDSKVRNLAEDTESKIDSLIGVAFY